MDFSTGLGQEEDSHEIGVLNIRERHGQGCLSGGTTLGKGEDLI